MPSIADTFTSSRAFLQAINTADKFAPEDIPFLRCYFLNKQGTSSFLFQWLDKLERGGLTREQVLSVVYGADYKKPEEHEQPTSPKKRKYTRRAKTPTGDEDETPGTTPETSPTRPRGKRSTEENEPVTPKARPKKKTAPPPPAKKPRGSKKETQVISESDLDEEDEDDDDQDEDDDEQFEAVRRKL